MTSEDVEKIIKSEIVNYSGSLNFPGIHLSDCLIKPFKQKYISASDNTQSFDLWTVLIESENGYRVFYDEEENTFGLANKSFNDELMYFGSYGTFLETLAGM